MILSFFLRLHFKEENFIRLECLILYYILHFIEIFRSKAGLVTPNVFFFFVFLFSFWVEGFYFILVNLFDLGDCLIIKNKELKVRKHPISCRSLREKRFFHEINISIHGSKEFFSSKYYGVLLILAHHIHQKIKDVFFINGKYSYPLIFCLKLSIWTILHMFFATA